MTPFQDSLDEIESQKREVEKAQKEKTDLLEGLNERLKWSIRWFEAIYQLAGLGFHADRLRVSFRHGRRQRSGAGRTDELQRRVIGARPVTPPQHCHRRGARIFACCAAGGT